MNKVELTGRLTRDPEVRVSQENMAIARFTLAVNRRKKAGTDPAADFIRCVAFNTQAEFIQKYFRKGMKAEVVGHLQTGSYTDKNGQTIYTTDVCIEDIEFGESKTSADSGPASMPTEAEGFTPIPDSVEGELPWQ